MELRRYGATLWRRKWAILAVAALAVAAVWLTGGLERSQSRYRATATLLVTTPPGQAPSFPVEAVRSLTVARNVVRQTGVSADPRAVLSNLKVSPRPGTSLVDFQVEDTHPERAALLANAFADAYLTALAPTPRPQPETLELLVQAHRDLRERAIDIDRSSMDRARKDWELRWLRTRDERLAQAYADVLLRGLLDGTATTTARLLDPATPPGRPVETALVRQARTVGGVAGAALLAAIALAFLLEYLDDRVRTEADVERAVGLPVLATLPSRARIRRALRRFAASGARQKTWEPT